MDYEAAIAKELEENGHALLLFDAEDDFPTYGYTIGLYEKYGHPELVVFGLDHDTIRILIGDSVDRVKEGAVIEPKHEYDDFFEGYKLMFNHVNVDEYKGLFGSGIDHNHGIEFPMLQLIWPDQEHRWPWDKEYDAMMRRNQPLLTA